jgi:hypothetical protein
MALITTNERRHPLRGAFFVRDGGRVLEAESRYPQTAHMNEPSASHCATCNAELRGDYCHACGEKAQRDPPTLVRFISELLGELLDTDGRVIRTLRLLVLRPGRLTAEYVRGRHKRYLSPAAVFILMNVLFFFVQPLANVSTFYASLHSQTNWYPYSEWAEERVASKLEINGLDRENYAREFDEASERYARTLIFLQVPLLAAGIMLVNLGKRRYFIEHMVFATHVYAVLLLLSVVASLGIYVYWALELGNTFNLELPFMAVTMGYLLLGMREVYEDSWVAASLKSLLLMGVLLVVISLFRLALFLVALWTVA